MRVLQLNLNHCRAAQDLLTQRVRELGVDVAMLCEQHTDLETQPWISDTTKKAAIWACGRLPFEQLPTNPTRWYVRAKIGGVHLYSCYAPPSASFEEFENFLDILAEDVRRHEPVAISGDFNAWSIEWGSRETDRRGEAIQEVFSTLNLILMNEGTTSTFRKGAASSIIDLTFISSALARGGCEWRVDEEFTNSDHQAIIWEINTNSRNGRRKKGIRRQTVGWNSKHLDAETFNLVMRGSAAPQSTTAEGITEEVATAIEAASDASMPRCRPSNGRAPVHWWNSTIAQHRRECLKARRQHQRARKRDRETTEELRRNYEEKRRLLRNAINSSKRDYWKELCAEVDRDPWGRPYKTVMHRIKSLPATTPTCPDTLLRIVVHLFPEKPELPDYHPEDGEMDIPGVTMEELMKACSRLQNGKAPGPSGTPNIALKSAVAARPDMFINMYNACLRQGVFPSRWKQQRLVLLPKGKKPPDDPSSFRPLCMLDSEGKNMERIVADRLEQYIDPQLSEFQFGFRKGKSTIDALELVTNIAEEAISGRRWRDGPKKYCLIVTLDIKNAFNSARWDRVLEALDKMGVPYYLRRMVRSYFSDRLLHYETEQGPAVHRVTGGVPQGSVLGPLLWNVMYDGLLHLEFPENTTLVAFADDVAVVLVAKHLEELQAAFSTTISRIRQWMRSADLSLAEHKTEALLVSSRKKMETITIRVGDHDIQSVPNIRYLGVVLDARLNYKEHIASVSRKASAVQGALSRIMPNIGGPRQTRKRLLATVVSSVLLYGAPVWAKSLEITSYRKTMSSVQRLSAIRVASAYRTVSHDAVNVVASCPPIDILAGERQRQHRRKKEEQRRVLCEEERPESLRLWQERWDSSTKGRWTHRLIPDVTKWVNRQHGEVGYYITQLLTGHGCFRAYLHRFKRSDSPNCHHCGDATEDAEHVFFQCPFYEETREELERNLDHTISPENIVEHMLRSQAAWNKVAEYAETIIKDLRTTYEE